MTDVLKVKKELTIYVDAFELARYLSGKIGKPVQVLGAYNGSSFTSTVRSGELPIYDAVKVKDFLETGYFDMEYSWSAVLCHAVNAGWIEPGIYVVKVSW